MGTAISIAVFVYGAILTITRLDLLGIDLGLVGVGLLIIGGIGIVSTRPWRLWEPDGRARASLNRSETT